MRVLYLAYEFPPAVGGGVMRAVKFATYLRDFGWDPVVLTVARRAHARAEALPDGLEVHRVRSLVPPEDQRAGRRRVDDGRRAGGPTGRRWLDRVRDRFLVPDTRVLWWPLARRRALALHRDAPFDAVLATAPPFSALCLGRELARRFRIPFVADLRDPWVDSFASLRAAERPERMRREEAMERLVVRDAAAVVVTAPALAEALAERHPESGSTRFHVITNGFDPADYEGVAPRELDHPALVYTGKLTTQYAPDALAAMLRELRSQDADGAPEIRLHVVGDVDAVAAGAFERAGVASAVTFHGPVPPSEVRRFQLGADVLVSSLGPDDARIRISGKVFEYLATGRPILALVPPGGATAEIVRATPLGRVCDPSDPARAARALVELLSAPQVTATPPSTYDRRTLTGALARILTDARAAADGAPPTRSGGDR